MKTFIILALLSTCAVAAPKHYDAGQIIMQELGTTGDTKSEAAEELVLACEGNPFVLANLAELVGVEKLQFEKMDERMYVEGSCVIKFLKTITETEN
jgi:hypothetical protein